MADDQFSRSVLDHNADYIERFAHVENNLELPDAEIFNPGTVPHINLNGVRVTIDLAFRLHRITRTNKARIGAGALRYAKGKRLPDEVAAYQSAFIFGYLGITVPEEEAEPELILCLTIDAFGGIAHAAPTDSVRRFNYMQAACATISEGWDNIKPPADF